MRVTQRVRSVAIKTGKSTSTIWRWLKAGCDLSSPASVNQFLQGNKRRRNSNTIRKFNTIDAKPGKVPGIPGVVGPAEIEPDPAPDLDQIELAPVGRRGTAAALQRLEEIEERAHARLMRAIEAGNPFQVKAAQEFYLRASETLRRLDLAVETERRTALEQIPIRQVAAVAIEISTLLRLSFEQFLGSESAGLMATTDLGEFKFLAIERFRGILHGIVKTRLRSDPPIPDWAAARVVEAWNVY